MLNDPTIYPVSIVLLILLSIALYQRLYNLTAFLVVTYFMYIGIIYLLGLQRNSDNPIFPVPAPITENLEIDTTAEVPIDSAVTIESFTATTDSISFVQNEIIPADSILSAQLMLNYIMVARDVDIKNRIAIDRGSVFSDSVGTLYCFTGIDNRDGGNQEILHKWTYLGNTVANVRMVVERSINWRCWSVVKINPEREGKWKITIFDSNEIEFGSTTFYIVKSE